VRVSGWVDAIEMAKDGKHITLEWREERRWMRVQGRNEIDK